MDPHRLGEQRSIALHRRVAELLREDPLVVERARSRVEQWAATGAVAGPYVTAWRRVLSLPLDQLCRELVNDGEAARALRQVSPFAGTIPPGERWRIRREAAARAKDAP